jgi:ABC-type sugar transport system permease subunit
LEPTVKKKRGVQSLKRIKRQENWMDVLFVSPQFVLYVGLTLVPLIVAFPMLFREQKSLFVEPGAFIGLQNFKAVFEKPLVDQFLSALWKTALYVVNNYLMVWLLGLTFALLMYELSLKTQRRVFLVVFLPYLLSGFGTGMIIGMLFSKETGTFNLLFRAIGLYKGSIDIYSPAVHALIPLFQGWRFAGFNMALFLSGLLAIPPDTVDSCRVDGANYFQRLIHIYLPQIVPTVMLITVMSMIGSFGIFDVPMGLNAMQGNHQVEFMAVLIYQQGFRAGTTEGLVGNLGNAVATSFVVYLPLLLIAFVLRRIQQKKEYEV